LRSSSAAPQFGHVREGSPPGGGGAASGSSAEGRGGSSMRTIVLRRGGRRCRHRSGGRGIEPENHAGGSPQRFDGCRVGSRRRGRRSRLLGGVVSFGGMASAAGRGQGEGGEERRDGSVSTHVDLRIAAHSTGKRQILSVVRSSDARRWRGGHGLSREPLENRGFRGPGRLVRPLKRGNGKKGVGMGVPALTERGESADSPLVFPGGLFDQPSIEAGSRASRMSRTLRASVSGVNGFGRNEAPASSATCVAIAASV
jgi:hypothetical protein